MLPIALQPRRLRSAKASGVTKQGWQVGSVTNVAAVSGPNGS